MSGGGGQSPHTTAKASAPDSARLHGLLQQAHFPAKAPREVWREDVRAAAGAGGRPSGHGLPLDSIAPQPKGKQAAAGAGGVDMTHGCIRACIMSAHGGEPVSSDYHNKNASRSIVDEIYCRRQPSAAATLGATEH